MVQTVLVGAFSQTNWATANDEFFLVYHDPYGGSWRTSAIHVATGAAANIVDRTTVAASAQQALRNLPNKVLDGVTVAAHAANGALTICKRSEDGSQTSSCT